MSDTEQKPDPMQVLLGRSWRLADTYRLSRHTGMPPIFVVERHIHDATARPVGSG